MSNKEPQSLTTNNEADGNGTNLLSGSLIWSLNDNAPPTDIDLFPGAGDTDSRPTSKEGWMKSDVQKVWPYDVFKIKRGTESVPVPKPSQKAKEPKTETETPAEETKKKKEEQKTQYADKSVTYLELVKKAPWEKSTNNGAKAFFDDGIWYMFDKPIKPRHIHFGVSTTTADRETCDFRLTTIKNIDEVAAAQIEYTEKCKAQDKCQEEKKAPSAEKDGVKEAGAPTTRRQLTTEEKRQCLECEQLVKKIQRKEDSDIIFFRLGYLKYMKLNEENMVQKFEEKIWYDIDLILNWETSNVLIYVDGQYKKTKKFFASGKKKVDDDGVEIKPDSNAISLYGLSPNGVSKFRDLTLCNGLCDDNNTWKKNLDLEALGGLAQYTFNALAVSGVLLASLF